MPKVYFNPTGPNSFEWVDSKEKVKQEPHKQAAEVTLRKLKGAQLEEVPATTPQTTSKWVISTNQ